MFKQEAMKPGKANSQPALVGPDLGRGLARAAPNFIWPLMKTMLMQDLSGTFTVPVSPILN